MDTRSKPIPLDWQQVITEWLANLQAGGASNQTARLRRAHLARFARAVNIKPAELADKDVISYLAYQSWSRETRRAAVASFRSFFRFIGRLELVETLPRVGADVPAPRPAPSDVYEIALERAEPRVRLMLRLGAELGLRRGEIARLHAEDIGSDLIGRSLMIHGKGGKIRYMPITDEFEAALRRQAGANGYVFEGNDNGHLSPNWIGKLMARALPGRWSAHTLRHRFATRAYNASEDLISVSRLLGHASVATTQRYIASDEARLRNVARLAA